MIGVFDSGFGGLTILAELTKKLPQYQYIYLGDNARAPYGNKSEDTIYENTREAVNFLFKRGCRIIIIACNTASAKALRRIQREYLPKNYPERRVLGVIIPAAENIAELSLKNKNFSPRIGLIATTATVNSSAYEKEIKKLLPKAKILARACPLLVDLIEENWLHHPETKMILSRYLKPLQKLKPDYLLLGCTHYPFLLNKIRGLVSKNTALFNPPPIVAAKLEDYLHRHPEIEKKLKRKKRVVYYTTDKEKKFLDFCRQRLRLKDIKVKKVSLAD